MDNFVLCVDECDSEHWTYSNLVHWLGYKKHFFIFWLSQKLKKNVMEFSF
jgi:hypothetical protein